MYGLSLINELKLPSANDCYSYAKASFYYIWWQRWDRLREQPQESRRSKYSTRGVVNDNQKEDGGGGGPDKRKCHKCGGEGHFKRNCPVKDEPGADRAGASPGRNRTDKGIKCFNCHRYGHMSMNCPDKANFYCGDRLGRSVVRVGKVEGGQWCRRWYWIQGAAGRW